MMASKRRAKKARLVLRGDTVKLPGRPVKGLVPFAVGNYCRHRRETCGYGNNPSHRDNGQPSAKDRVSMRAVHRLNVGGLIVMRAISLRYSRFPWKHGRQEEPFR
jgi:hypothetical protein